MKQAVLDNYSDFTTKFEGALPYMYLDVKGLVTTGIGNLVDPVGATLSLPWKRPDGSLASQNEIRDAWNTVKSHQEMSQRGGGAFGGLTSIRLDKNGIQQLVNSKLHENEQILKGRFPAFDSWPADAQMALLSMAWAAGAHFRAPKLEAALNQLYPDFETAAKESHLATAGNPGLVPRNEANLTLFENAAKALKHGYDVAMLHYPDILPDAKTVAKAGIGIGGIAALCAAGWGLSKVLKG